MFKEYVGRLWKNVTEKRRERSERRKELEAQQRCVLEIYEEGARLYGPGELDEYERCYQKSNPKKCEKCDDSRICKKILNGEYVIRHTPVGDVVGLPEKFP
jgi:DNA/RNA-binding domain of Phe-tRNA-synthetase-like protein